MTSVSRAVPGMEEICHACGKNSVYVALPGGRKWAGPWFTTTFIFVVDTRDGTSVYLENIFLVYSHEVN